MPRVAGVDPGTVSFDLCVLEDSAPVCERTFATGSLSADATPLLAALADHGPYDLVYGPSGYGLPLLAGVEVGERELAQMVLVRRDEAADDVGIGGLRSLLRALASSGLPVVFGPGVVHLPTVPAYRKRNRIDMGTADKVCAAALAIDDQARRLEVDVRDTALVLVELGGAFTAALAVAGGAIVDGVGGSSGPPGARAAGALDGELAYLLGPALGKGTLFTGGALADAGASGVPDFAARWSDPACAEGWAALVEGVVKAVRGLLVSAPAAREVVVSGRLARLPELVAAVADALQDLGPVRALVVPRASAAARGAALLADGLCGGRHAPLVDALALRRSAGTTLDHLLIAGADTITLG